MLDFSKNPLRGALLLGGVLLGVGLLLMGSLRPSQRDGVAGERLPSDLRQG